VRNPLKPRRRPSWKSELTTAQFGPIAEDLLGVALAAAASGSGTVARPLIDRGVDLYLRRLRTLLTFPIQVKACRHVSPDAVVTEEIAVADLRDLSGGYLAMLHVPPPYDQLYQRLYLIPIGEFRQRSPRTRSHGIESYRFTANFGGSAEDMWSPFAVDVERLAEWIASIPSWTKAIPPPPLPAKPDVRLLTRDADNFSTSGLGTLWAEAELERVGGDGITVAEDRVRLDPMTLLVHHHGSQRFAGIHIRTAIFNETRRIHFDVKRPHFFVDRGLWVLLVLLRPDRRVHDFCLLIPSKDIPDLGYSETMTLDPLTKRFLKYRVPSEEFAAAFLKKALAARLPQAASPDQAVKLEMAG
jgi:hypothetical protein